MRLRLMPRQEKFFELFDELAQNAVSCARALQALVEDPQQARERAADATDLEHKGDRIVHEAFNRLNNSFITPIDREDIHSLLGGMDDIIDYIESTCDRLVLYQITEMTPEAREMADVLVRAADQVREAISHLSEIRNIRKILDPCVRVNDFENEGDRINRRALQIIFSGSMAPLEALKWREVYDHFEKAIDKCEDVAHVLESIVVKNV